MRVKDGRTRSRVLNRLYNSTKEEMITKNNIKFQSFTLVKSKYEELVLTKLINPMNHKDMFKILTKR